MFVLQLVLDDFNSIRQNLYLYRQLKKTKNLNVFVNAYNAHPEIFEIVGYPCESDDPVLATIGKRKTPESARIALVTGFTEHNVSYKNRNK